MVKLKGMMHLITLIFIVMLQLSCASDDNPNPGDTVGEDTILEQLKVLNYNVRNFSPPSRPAGSIDLEPVIEVINGAKPDIITIQEVDVNTTRSGNRNLAIELADRLRMRHFFAKAIDYQGGEYGVLILSRFPISETTIHRLPSDATLGGEPRILATVKITLPDGREYRVGNTHMDALANPGNRILQAERIVEIAEDETLPFILAGDFNAVPDTEEVDILLSRFINSCVTCSPTFPAVSPNRIIDYITYFSPANKLAVDSSKVLSESSASDHRPVYTVFKLN